MGKVMLEPTEWRLDDAAAEYFETHFVPAIFSAWAPILLDAGGVSHGQRVLDVACGTGIVARVAADRLAGAGEVTGLDLNSSMIKVAPVCERTSIGKRVMRPPCPFPTRASMLCFARRA
jgi:ubiquinone/menaquinone biosynthesis C-methylase UbiE